MTEGATTTAIECLDSVVGQHEDSGAAEQQHQQQEVTRIELNLLTGGHSDADAGKQQVVTMTNKVWNGAFLESFLLRDAKVKLAENWCKKIGIWL